MTCLVTSALMFFTPVTGDRVAETVTPPLTLTHTQVAIAEVLKRLPATSDVQSLRVGLVSLQDQLATVEDEATAQTLIKQEVKVLSDLIKADPNYDRIFEALDQIMEDAETNLLSQSFSSLLRSRNFQV